MAKKKKKDSGLNAEENIEVFAGGLMFVVGAAALDPVTATAGVVQAATGVTKSIIRQEREKEEEK